MMNTSRRGFLAGLLGITAIAVLPKGVAPAVESAPIPAIDPFAIEAPPGWTYQWVRSALLGVPDPENVQARVDNGWTFVEPAEHPGAPTSTVGAAIETGGLLLMQKRTELVDKPRPYPIPTSFQTPIPTKLEFDPDPEGA